MFNVNDLYRLLEGLKASGAGESVVVFRSTKESLGWKEGGFVVSGLIPTSVGGEGTALVIDNSELPGPSVGRPLCIVACNPFLRQVRYIQSAPVGRYAKPLEEPRSDPHGPGR